MNQITNSFVKRIISQDFIKAAPKIELHAHLNGCVRKSTLFEIAERKSVYVDYSMFEYRNMEGAFQIFSLIHQVLKDLPDIRRVSREVLEDFRDQNVVYLELRTTPKSCEFGTYTKEQYLTAVLEEIQDFLIENGNKMQARLLVSIDRGRSIEDAQSTLDLLLKYKDYPLIAGLDYSGNPTRSTFKDYENLFAKARSEGLKTTVHIAELDGEVCLKESYDIVNFKPDRLGHFNYYNKELYDKVRQLGIPIEMCPTSNFYTLSMKNMNEHHFKEFFYEGHTLNLNTDDTCVFDTDSTLEHQKMIESFNLTEEQFNSLLTRSVSMIFDEAYKPILKQKIQDYFSSTQTK